MAARKRKKKAVKGRVRAKAKPGRKRVRAADGGRIREIAQRLGAERGLELTDSLQPGRMFLKGGAGEKLVLENSDEFLDLVSVGGGRGNRGKELFQLLDDIANEGGAQARRGTTITSQAGQDSIERAKAAGRLVRNPAGKGFLSTAQAAGKKALRAAGKFGKSAVGGVTALLDPVFAAIQNQPEGAELLRGIGLNIPETETNRIIGKHGGSLAANAAKSGQDVARVRAGVGGITASNLGFQQPIPQNLAPVSGAPPTQTQIPGIQTLAGFDQGAVTQTQQGGTSAGTGSTTTSGQTSGTTTTSADVGEVGSIVNDLRQFQGFSPQGQGTLDEILQTGLPTDVSGITEAAKIRGLQEFDAAQNTISERLANMGLLSSSAQTTAIAEEQRKLGENIAATGLEAEVDEARLAADRKVTGVGLDAQGRQIESGALSAGGGLALGAAGLNTSATSTSSQSGTSDTATSGTTGGTGTVSQSLPTPPTASAPGPATSPFSNPGTPIFGGSNLAGGPSIAANNSGGDQNRIALGGGNFFDPNSGNMFNIPQGTQQSPIPRAAKGGRVSREDAEFERFLQSMGADISRALPGIPASRSNPKSADFFRNQALASLGGESGARFLFANPKERNELIASGAEDFRKINTGTGKFGPTNQAQFLGFAVDRHPELFGGKRRQIESAGPDLSSSLTGETGLVPDAGAGASGAGGAHGGGIGSLRPGVRDQFLPGSGVDILGPQGSQRNRQFFAAGGPVQGDPAPVSTPRAGATPQPVLPQENGQLVPGILDPRRQFFDEGGGVAPGVDSGEDQVPALLRSEELVVVPELVEELMNVDPSLPQPGLITALQELAKQPLEFGEEEGEFVAGHGGRPIGGAGVAFPFSSGNFPPDPTNFPPPQLPGAGTFQSPGGGDANLIGAILAGLFPGVPENFSTDPDSEFARQQAAIQAGPGGSRVGDPDPITQAPGLQRTSPQLDLNPEAGAVAEELFRAPSFAESVGEEGERKFTLEGGGALAGPADIRGGLDPAKGLLSGGEGFAPGVPRQASGGNFSSISQTIDPETGLAMDFSQRQLSRLERAQQTADLTRSAIATDPVGGPEKQARMFRALEVANREQDAAMNELLKIEELRLQRQQVQNQGVVAQGQLNQSVAATLAAKARETTAAGEQAKILADIAASDPVVAQALNFFDAAAKLDAETQQPEIDRLMALLDSYLAAQGLEFTETGFIAGLFDRSLPAVEVTQQVQSGLPGPEQQQEKAFMSRAQAALPPDRLEMLLKVTN